MKNGGQRPPFAFKLCVMALYYDLPVFKDVYKLTLLIYSLTKDFSKEYKYTLGQDLKKDVMVLMRSIYRANKAQNKKEYLETFLDDFELLKLEVRLCVDMKIISIKKQAEISLLMDGIGKQITGWRNSQP
ncbi:four helix bundle protein [Flavobacteriales bacterium]|nr:four helix bundle protein [Flavobacteriales bacterium]